MSDDRSIPPAKSSSPEAQESAPSSRSPPEVSLAKARAALNAEAQGRAQAEEDLRIAHRFLESIVENVPDMIFLKDAAELRFVRFNRAGEELLGYPREEMLGKNDHDFFPKDEADAFTAGDREVLRRGTMLDVPAEPIHTRHRGLRWLHTRKIPLRDEHGRPTFLLGISEDVTDRRRAEDDKRAAEEELRRTADELSRSNEELEQFAYVASHDLQEPLRKIQAFSDLLLRTCGPALGTEGNDYLQRIVSASGRMRTLIQDLLALSRVSSRPKSFAPVDLADIAADALADLEVTLGEAGATVIIGDLPIVTADAGQMRQLFTNLLGNGLKFTRDGQPPKVRVTCTQQDGRFEIAFEDEGIGFDDRHAERIFKPFQRLHAAGRYPGTGIGLTICRKICERHGGSIRAHSRPGRGATFVVTLPAALHKIGDRESDPR